VHTADDVQTIDTLLTQLESEAALEVLIEEADGLTNVEDIARSSLRLEALIFGPGDFSASQGIRWAMAKEAAYPGDIWAYHRSRIVVAARAAGIDAIDGPFANFRDADGYRIEAARAALIGYVGKWAIHPSQIEIANDVFSPKPKEVDSARELVEAYAKSEAEGAGAAGMGGVMIDAATARIMEGVLRRAELIERAPQ
jgi:citrate lyase subunit beta/citryl-CoA lyase